jgi:hypothetical protein
MAVKRVMRVGGFAVMTLALVACEVSTHATSRRASITSLRMRW